MADDLHVDRVAGRQLRRDPTRAVKMRPSIDHRAAAQASRFVVSFVIDRLRSLEHVDSSAGSMRVEHRAQIVRQRRRELERLAGARLREREPLGVQERPRQPLHRAQIVRHPAMHAAVQRVADDRMADGVEVDANLVRAPGRDRDAQQRQPGNVPRPRHPRDGRARAPRARRNLLAMNRIAADRRCRSACAAAPAPRRARRIASRLRDRGTAAPAPGAPRRAWPRP